MTEFRIRRRNYKTFRIVMDSPTEFTIEFNYRENRRILFAFLITLSVAFILILKYLGDYMIQPPWHDSRSLFNILVSLIFVPLLGMCAFFFLRSTFFKKILSLNKREKSTQIKNFYGILTIKKELPNNLVSKIFIQRNIITSTTGIRNPSHYSLKFELHNGVIINIFTSFLVYELELVEKLILKNLIF